MSNSECDKTVSRLSLNLSSMSFGGRTMTTTASMFNDEAFNIVLNLWGEWDVTDIISPLSKTCKLMRRLTFPLSEQQSKCRVADAYTFEYKCSNIVITSRSEFDSLSRLLHLHGPYKIKSLHVKLPDCSPSLVMSDLHAIQTIMLDKPPFTLILEYSKNTAEASLITMYIPDNVGTFTFKLFFGKISVYTNPNSILQQLYVRGHLHVTEIHAPSITLIYGTRYNFPSPIPPLTEISFPNNFNGDVTNLQNLLTLKKLFFSTFGIFNQPLDRLPESLTQLQVGGAFRHTLTKLPLGLKQLVVLVEKYNYNENFNHLPPNLKHLTISVYEYYKHPFSSLPQSLQTLSITCFNAPRLITNIPSQLLHLIINVKTINKEVIQAKLPDTLQVLKLTGKTNCFSKLPHNLVTLDMGEMCDTGNPSFLNNCCFYKTICEDQLPHWICSIHLPAYFNESLPSSMRQLAKLKRIEFGAKYNKPLINLPNCVEFIRFFSYDTKIEFNQPLEGLPKDLKELVFEGCTNFNLEITKPLPVGLRVLQLVGARLPNSFQQRSDYLRSHLSSNFNQPLSTAVLPTTLHTLVLGSSFSHPLDNLPASIKTIFLPTTFPPASKMELLEKFPSVTIWEVEYVSEKMGKEKRPLNPDTDPNPDNVQPGFRKRRKRQFRFKKNTKLSR